jgi:apolipoprotein D and lipocalin family protein
MRRSGLVVVLCLILGSCAFLQPSRNAHVPPPAKPVDLARYLGRWYEYARYDSSFERGCTDATADYAAMPNAMIRVVNTCTRHGRRVRALGRAIVVPRTGNARLRVSFFGPFFIGRYWVLDHASDYSWSIVGEPSGGYLWLLTRAAHPSAALGAALVAQAARLGYDTGALVFTPQAPG